MLYKIILLSVRYKSLVILLTAGIVLNGIVLIEEFKHLKKTGIQDIQEVILQGTQNRLRPVLLTALAAALGFLPMVISTSAGAEVQKPLATVVVGGLVSATLLTLLILPVLYAYFERPKPNIKINSSALFVLALILFPGYSFSQTQSISIEEAIQLAMDHNAELQVALKKIERQEQLLPSAFSIDKTELFYNNDQNNIAPNNFTLDVWGINQSIKFPTVYGAQRKVLQQRIQLAEDEYELIKLQLIKEVRTKYHEILYWQTILKKQTVLDSLYGKFLKGSSALYKLGGVSEIDLLNSQAKRNSIAIQSIEIKEKLNAARFGLMQKLQIDGDFEILPPLEEQLKIQTIDTLTHAGLNYFSDVLVLSQKELQLEKQSLLPDLNLSFFRGTNTYPDAAVYSGVQVGVAVPLWVFGQKSMIKAAKTTQDIRNLEKTQFKKTLHTNYNTLLASLRSYEAVLNNYRENGKEVSEKTLLFAEKALQNGEIDFSKYLQLLEDATRIEIDYLTALFNYNKTVLEINYLLK